MKKNIYKSKYGKPYVKLCEAHESFDKIKNSKWFAAKLFKLIRKFEMEYYKAPNRGKSGQPLKRIYTFG